MLRFVSNLTNFPFLQRLLLHLHQNPHIIYYHLVANTRPVYYYQLPLSIDAFKFQIDWLRKNNFEFVSLEEIEHQPKNKKLVAITTDDGFAENYTTLAPLLKDYNIPATFFLINNCIDNRDLMWMNKLATVEQKIGRLKTLSQVYELMKSMNLFKKGLPSVNSIYRFIPMHEKDTIANEIWKANMPISFADFLEEQKPYLSGNQIRELIAAGFSIGAHTLSHPKCSQLSFEELKQEVLGSISQLRMQFNTPIDFFAYPFGDRPSDKMEREIFIMSKSRAFLGTKNNDKPLKGRMVWERDKMEQPEPQSLFWFSTIPLIRKFILNPVGIYK